MSYQLVKHLHLTCATISIAGFVIRGLWMMRDSPRLRERWVRVLPHVNDTIFLTAAVALAVMSNQLPLATSWVTAKVFGLLAYIVLGSLALKAGRPMPVRVACWIAAIAVFGWIVSVAVLRDPAGFIGRIFQ